MLISIITPVYNSEKFLKKCIDSILNQTYSNFELILVDDGSVDKSPQICDEYARKDSRIVVIHQKNQGQAAARNKALDICKGDYISFIDSDDYVNPQMLEILMYTMQQSEADIAVCDYVQGCDTDFNWNENALKAKVEYYFVALNNFFKAFNTNKKIYHSEIKHIRKKMRKYLKIYGKIFCITANNHIWYYEIAYPKSINLYWIVKSKIRSKNK